MNDPVAAFCKHAEVRIQGSATGALAGRTFAAKDLFDVEGYCCCAGNPDWLRTHDEPARNTAPAVQALIEAGATLVGKTILDELAFSLSGRNIHYGTPKNTAAPDHVCGGSSSGSAAAVAAKLVDFALGSDTSGSIRIPASYCGLFGFRPTHGRIPTTGMVPLAPGFDTVGWLARDPDLLVAVGEVLLDEEASPLLPRRLLIADDAFAILDPELRESFEPDLLDVSVLADAAKHVRLCESSLEDWQQTEMILKNYEAWRTHRAWLQAVHPKLGPEIEKRFMQSSEITEEEYSRARNRRAEIRKRMAEMLDEDTVVCIPTAANIAPSIDSPIADLEEIRRRTLMLTCIAGLAGTPQVSLPLSRFQNCPAGLSLLAAPQKDMMLLMTAATWSAR